MSDSMNEIAFQIILLAGNGRSSAMEAMQEAKAGDFEAAQAKLEEAKDELNKAHKYQTQLLQNEASGQKEDINIILIHAQDHLMTSIVVKDLAAEIIELHQKLK